MLYLWKIQTGKVKKGLFLNTILEHKLFFWNSWLLWQIKIDKMKTIPADPLGLGKEWEHSGVQRWTDSLYLWTVLNRYRPPTSDLQRHWFLPLDCTKDLQPLPLYVKGTEGQIWMNEWRNQQGAKWCIFLKQIITIPIPILCRRSKFLTKSII